MAKQTLFERLKEVIRTLDDDAIFTLWNEYVRANNYYDDELFSMDFFDEFYQSYQPSEVATRCFYGHGEFYDSPFNPNDVYFYLNGYGNPCSLNYLSYNQYQNDYSFDRFDENSVIDWLEESEEDCGIGEIADVFSEIEDDADEDEE